MFESPLHLVKGIIFDLDGTLLTSSLNFQVIRRQIKCPPGQDILSFITGLSLHEQHRANQIVLDHEMNDAKQARWIEGVQHCLSVLQSRRIPLAIVTRNNKEATWLKLNNNKLLVDIVITREDAPPKPNPNALLKIAVSWNLPVQTIAYIGDYLYDVQAAKNAGMFAGLYAPQELPEYAHLADWVFSHFNQLTALLKSQATHS